MIRLRNYPKLGTYILIGNNTYLIEDTDDWHKEIQGVGGISEDGQVVGIYVQDNNLFFFYNGLSFETSIADLKCTNNYVSKLERCFRVTIGGQDICNIVYEPFIDPGMIFYDAELDECDALLYISGLLKSEESIEKFMGGMELIRKQNER